MAPPPRPEGRGGLTVKHPIGKYGKRARENQDTNHRGTEPIMRHVPRCIGALRPHRVVLDPATQTEESGVVSRGQNVNSATAPSKGAVRVSKLAFP